MSMFSARSSFQSVVQKSGFRSLGDDEVVEFTAELRSKGLEATHVRAVGGGDVQGSHRRPGAKRKAKKPRWERSGRVENFRGLLSLKTSPSFCLAPNHISSWGLDEFCRSEDVLRSLMP